MWLDIRQHAHAQDGQYIIRMQIHVEPIVDRSSEPYFHALLIEKGNGVLETQSHTFGFGSMTTYSTAFGPSPSPDQVLFIFGTRSEDDLLLAIIPEVVEGGAPIPAAGNLPPMPIGSPPLFAIHSPKNGISSGIEIEDVRTGTVAGSYTAGSLAYRAPIAAPSLGTSATFVESYCTHEGEGRFEFLLSADGEARDAGVYTGPSAQTSRLVKSHRGEATLELVFRPIRDPATECGIGIASFALAEIGITNQVIDQIRW